MSIREEALLAMLSDEREQRLKLLKLVDDLQTENNWLRKSKLVSHGVSGYSQGCRCETCSKAHSAYQAEYRMKKKKS